MSGNTAAEQEFSKWRTIFWPIHSYELKKFIPMLCIFFLLTFDYNVLRVMKDTLVVTARHSGAEVIPFIKVWVMFPGAVLMTFLYTRLANRWSKETVFYTMISLFLGFFALFAYVLYPMRDLLHSDQFADFLINTLPTGASGFVAMSRNWSFSIFYAMAELWSNIILFLLCWGFANQITHIKEARRFYGLFGVGANFSGVIAGAVSIYFSTDEYNPRLPFGSSGWEQSMMILITLVLISGFGALVLFYRMNKSILRDPHLYNPDERKEGERVKGKLSMRESFSYLLGSKYIFSIAIVMIAYNVVINLIEVLWKHEARALFPDSGVYNIYMNYVSSIIGVIATLASLLISGNSLRKFGWTFTALLTPAIILVTSIFFFFFLLMKEDMNSFTLVMLGKEAAFVVVMIGSVQNILARAAKYTVFDSTKEMAFVPLLPEDKIKGKAAIDGICSRLGKSGGSIIHQGLLLVFQTLNRSAPVVFTVLISIVAVWVIAVNYVGRQFEQMISGTPEATKEEELKVSNI